MAYSWIPSCNHFNWSVICTNLYRILCHQLKQFHQDNYQIWIVQGKFALLISRHSFLNASTFYAIWLTKNMFYYHLCGIENLRWRDFYHTFEKVGKVV